MAMRVLVVDDSGFFRRRLKEILASDPGIEVIDTANDGAEAVAKARSLRPDVITMDVEMPVMDGISAVRQIMSERPTPILMFSSLTHDGAKATLDALDAGAADFLPKRLEEIAGDHQEAKRLLCDRVRAIARRRTARAAAPVQPAAAAPATAANDTSPATVRAKPLARGKYKVVAIGTSTGGPVALQQVLSQLPADFPLPILLIQHMPGSFTPAFAERLNQGCAITVREAHDGDELKPGTAYLAPGGRQMEVVKNNGGAILRVRDSSDAEHYKPSVDTSLDSLVSVYPGEVLAIILTGMGADGREGVRRLKQSGAQVWAQDEASCVVYGMPMAVVEAGLADQVLPLSQIGVNLAQGV
jgi:two-component system chemotaxis response regulator CheB